MRSTIICGSLHDNAEDHCKKVRFTVLYHELTIQYDYHMTGYLSRKCDLMFRVQCLLNLGQFGILVEVVFRFFACMFLFFLHGCAHIKDAFI